MARAGLFSRRDWTQEPGVSFSGGNWWTGFDPLLTIQPEHAICARTRLPQDTTFDCDLGASRQVGIIHFQHLWVSQAARMRVRIGADPTFASTTYDSGIVSGWPRVQEAFDYHPFGQWSFAGLAEPEEFAALGMSRWFIPPSIVSARYLRIEIWDRVGGTPPRLGYFGVCEAWEMPRFPMEEWSIGIVDDSEVVNAAYGSRFIREHAPRRRLQLGFDLIGRNDFLERLMTILPSAGVSIPAAVVIDPDTTQLASAEKLAVFGLLEQATIASSHFALFDMPLTIEQI